jgi:hypothetical protein
MIWTDNTAVTIYEDEPECTTHTEKRARTIAGSETSKCYTFGDDMPGTSCTQIQGGGTGGCTGANLVPRSLQVHKGSCVFYYGSLCSSFSSQMPDGSCMSGENNPGAGQQIKSFKCVCVHSLPAHAMTLLTSRHSISGVLLWKESHWEVAERIQRLRKQYYNLFSSSRKYT